MTVGLLMFKDNCLNVFHDMFGGGGEDEREKRETRDREFQNNHWNQHAVKSKTKNKKKHKYIKYMAKTQIFYPCPNFL